ncbi:MAG: hypothetical protein U5L04_01495 [Trueperaceae bacterium]|nr:hypothetical protein [Trueperaceae bacterium]
MTYLICDILEMHGQPHYIPVGAHPDRETARKRQKHRWTPEGCNVCIVAWPGEPPELDVRLSEREVERADAVLIDTDGRCDDALKLSEAEVVVMRARYARGGVLQRELAEEYGLSATHVGNIIRGAERAASGGPVKGVDYDAPGGWEVDAGE